MSETRLMWKRISGGLEFIGFGVFFLLSAQGLLHRGFWLDALSFWPVCLIALGLRTMFQTSRTPWAVLLSPFVIMSTLGYLAWRGPEAPNTDWRSVEAVRERRAESWELRASIALVDLDLRPAALSPERFLEGRVAPSNRGRVTVSNRGTSSRVHLSNSRWGTHNIFFLPGKRHRWDMEVSDDLPMTLRLASAFAAGKADLQDIEVTEVDLDGAFNDLALYLGPPSTDTRIELEGAFNKLELVIPEATPVHIYTDGLINIVDRREDNPDRSGPAYRVRADGAFNEIVIRSQPRHSDRIADTPAGP